MKALIRNKGETVIENSIEGIDWETGMPLTNPGWIGGPYTLVEEYVPPLEVIEDNVVSEPNAEQLTKIAERNAKIAELKTQLAALENDL